MALKYVPTRSFYFLLLLVSKWLVKCGVTGAAITDSNARVCSAHFTQDDYIKPVLPDFKPMKAILKPHAIPSVFTCSPLLKRRRFSEMRGSRRDRNDFSFKFFMF